MKQSDPGVPQEARQAAERGDLIAAIKITREATGLGLKDSKEAVEHYLAGKPDSDQQFRAAAAGRGGGIRRIVLSAALVVAAIAAYAWVSGKLPGAP